MAITLSAFTLIPYALVLLQLRVFYAREEPWTPILLVVLITAVKVAGSLAAPHLTTDPELVAGYLGLANGLGFLAGATLGYLLLRRRLDPPGGRLFPADVVRTVLVTITAALAAGLTAHVLDRLAGLASLTEHFGAAGSLLRLAVLGLVMGPIIAGVLLGAKVPEAIAATAAVRSRLGRRRVPADASVQTRSSSGLTYPDLTSTRRTRQFPGAMQRGHEGMVGERRTGKGAAVSDTPPVVPRRRRRPSTRPTLPRPRASTGRRLMTSSPMCPMSPPSQSRQRSNPSARRKPSPPQAHPALAPTTATTPPANRWRSTRPANRRSRPRPPPRTCTSSPAPPSARGATACWSSTADHPPCSSGRPSTPRWTGRWR